MAKEISLKHAVVVGPKVTEFVKEIAKLAGISEGQAIIRALTMYREIKRMEKQGYKPCMLKGRTARLLKEE